MSYQALTLVALLAAALSILSCSSSTDTLADSGERESDLWSAYSLYAVDSASWPDGTGQLERRYFIHPVAISWFPQMQGFLEGEYEASTLQELCEFLRNNAHIRLIYLGNPGDPEEAGTEGIHEPSADEFVLLRECSQGQQNIYPVRFQPRQ